MTVKNYYGVYLTASGRPCNITFASTEGAEIAARWFAEFCDSHGFYDLTLKEVPTKVACE